MITDFDVLEGVLAEIQAATPMTVLHREGDVAARAVSSDVDVGLGADPLAVLGAVTPRLERRGILPILLFHYDRGSYSVFCSNRRATGGAQVDLLHDPRGAGRYGVRTDELLARTREGERWPRTDDLDESLYVLRKRQVKGDAGGIARALAGVDPQAARARSDEVFSPRAASSVAAALAGQNGHPVGPLALWRSRALRPSRLTRRSGYLAHVTGARAAGVAAELAATLGRLIHATAVENPSTSLLTRDLWRPRLVVSSGDPAPWPEPDAVLSADGDAAGVAARLVEAMHRTLISRFRLEPAA